jgi:hypothetical protein
VDLIKILNPQHGVTVVDLRSPLRYSFYSKFGAQFESEIGYSKNI